LSVLFLLTCFCSIFCPVSALLSVIFLFYSLSCFCYIACPFSVLLSVLFLLYCLSCFCSIVCPFSIYDFLFPLGIFKLFLCKYTLIYLLYRILHLLDIQSENI
jgi:polyferredoxin